MNITSEQAILLNKTYREPRSPAYMGSISQVYNIAHATDPTLTKHHVKHWMLGQESYALAPPISYKHPHEKIVVYGRDDLMAADLAEMQTLSQFNDGVRYILVLRNCFTKFVSIGFLHDKTGPETAKVFEYMLLTQVPYVCKTLVTDSGKEFLNKDFQAVCTSFGIKMYQPRTGKAYHAENAILMLKTRLYRYFRDTQNKRYIEILPYIVLNYNMQRRVGLGVAPNDVTPENEFALFYRQYGRHMRDPATIVADFKVGDTVRRRLQDSPFVKSFHDRFTNHLYIIKKVNALVYPPKYHIQEKDDPDAEIFQVRQQDIQLAPNTQTNIADINFGIHKPKPPRRPLQAREIPIQEPRVPNLRKTADRPAWPRPE